MSRILVVEDDRELNKTVCMYLRQNGYEPTGCLSAEEASEALDHTHFDIILSDIMMPDMDGFAFADAIRSVDQEIPILFMTARDDFAAKQRGFRIGIDDYMVKPVDLDELLLRIEALLRRVRQRAVRRLEAGSLLLDTEEHAAYVDGEPLPLTVREFDILYKLLANPKKTFSRAQLMDEFWDADTAAGTRTVDVYITKLRGKLAACRDVEIQSVYGLGYKGMIHTTTEG